MTQFPKDATKETLYYDTLDTVNDFGYLPVPILGDINIGTDWFLYIQNPEHGRLLVRHGYDSHEPNITSILASLRHSLRHKRMRDDTDDLGAGRLGFACVSMNQAQPQGSFVHRLGSTDFLRRYLAPGAGETEEMKFVVVQ
jgi:hypothetical protein